MGKRSNGIENLSEQEELNKYLDYMSTMQN